MEMAGNMMCVPDFLAVWYVCALSIDSSAWEHNLHPHFLPHLSSGPDGPQAAGWIDHTRSIHSQVVNLLADEDVVSSSEDELEVLG